jgi:hypothetical protein
VTTNELVAVGGNTNCGETILLKNGSGILNKFDT